MCGILGTLPKSDEALFKKALDSIAHRGPDGYGIWSSDDISLGHRRLAILDLSASGRQPMSYADGRFQTVLNGEIYNFVEIRKELEHKGYHFQSESDTEVLLASFMEWGEECLLKFNGMWAVAIWDTHKRRLFLARDRFGKKPLFYAFVGGRFVFASEMKAIFPFLPSLSPSPDFHWMAKNIFAYEQTEKCLIEGIQRFPAGHYGYLEDGRLSLTRYWNTLDHLATPSQDYSVQVEEFRELFVDACRLRMRSDVPVGTALSGGLDSSATISTMAHIARSSMGERVSGNWQHAFVAAFPGTPLDESYYARKVVDHLGIEATFIDIDPLKTWDRLDDYLYHFEDLYITSPVPMLMTYAAVKEHGVTVSIDGHGADELFSGYGHILETLWDAGLNIGQIANVLDVYNGTLSNNQQFKRRGNTRTYASFMVRKLARTLLGRGPLSRDREHPSFKRMDNFTQQLYIIFHETILPTLLRNYDRYSMMNGVEIRMPFMDHRIVSYVFSLPWTSKMGDGYTKKLIRDAVAPFMPHEVAYRKTKIGFNSPIVDWMQGPLKEWFEDTANSSEFLSCSLLDDPRKLQHDIMEATSGANSMYGFAENIWTRMTPYLWERAVLRRKQ